jgi:hypothetical protein
MADHALWVEVRNGDGLSTVAATVAETEEEAIDRFDGVVPRSAGAATGRLRRAALTEVVYSVTPGPRPDEVEALLRLETAVRAQGNTLPAPLLDALNEIDRTRA